MESVATNSPSSVTEDEVISDLYHRRSPALVATQVKSSNKKNKNKDKSKRRVSFSTGVTNAVAAGGATRAANNSPNKNVPSKRASLSAIPGRRDSSFDASGMYLANISPLSVYPINDESDIQDIETTFKKFETLLKLRKQACIARARSILSETVNGQTNNKKILNNSNNILIDASYICDIINSIGVDYSKNLYNLRKLENDLINKIKQISSYEDKIESYKKELDKLKLTEYPRIAAQSNRIKMEINNTIKKPKSDLNSAKLKLLDIKHNDLNYIRALPKPHKSLVSIIQACALLVGKFECDYDVTDTANNVMLFSPTAGGINDREKNNDSKFVNWNELRKILKPSFTEELFNLDPKKIDHKVKHFIKDYYFYTDDKGIILTEEPSHDSHDSRTSYSSHGHARMNSQTSSMIHAMHASHTPKNSVTTESALKTDKKNSKQGSSAKNGKCGKNSTNRRKCQSAVNSTAGTPVGPASKRGAKGKHRKIFSRGSGFDVIGTVENILKGDDTPATPRSPDSSSGSDNCETCSRGHSRCNSSHNKNMCSGTGDSNHSRIDSNVTNFSVLSGGTSDIYDSSAKLTYSSVNKVNSKIGGPLFQWLVSIIKCNDLIPKGKELKAKLDDNCLNFQINSKRISNLENIVFEFERSVGVYRKQATRYATSILTTQKRIDNERKKAGIEQDLDAAVAEILEKEEERVKGDKYKRASDAAARLDSAKDRIKSIRKKISDLKSSGEGGARGRTPKETTRATTTDSNNSRLRVKTVKTRQLTPKNGKQFDMSNLALAENDGGDVVCTPLKLDILKVSEELDIPQIEFEESNPESLKGRNGNQLKSPPARLSLTMRRSNSGTGDFCK